MYSRPICAALLLLASFSPVQVNAKTSTAASTTCSTVPIATIPAGLHCGSHGYLKHPNPYMKPTLQSSLATCRDTCLALPASSCTSFGIDESINECTLYKTTLDSQGLNGGSNSSYASVYLYNRKCFTKSCSTISPTTSASTLTTSTTTSTMTSSSTTTCATLVTASCGSVPAPTFLAQVVNSGSLYNGQYLNLGPTENTLVTSPDDATVLTLSPDSCDLIDTANGDGDEVVQEKATDVEYAAELSDPNDALTCNIANDGTLTCQSPFYPDLHQLFVGNGRSGSAGDGAVGIGKRGFEPIPPGATELDFLAVVPPGSGC